VSSGVSRDATGWWLEAQIANGVLSPVVPAEGTFGVDFNFRDNDDNNNPSLTTVYAWSDPERSGSFPNMIPNRWGRAVG
jgi:hypothetical protein